MSSLQVRLEGWESQHLYLLRALSWSHTPEGRLFGAFPARFSIASTNGSAMSAAEASVMEEELRGLSLLEVEVCLSFSVEEVFAVDARGESIWDSGVPEVPDNERSLKLFLCFVLERCSFCVVPRWRRQESHPTVGFSCDY